VSFDPLRALKPNDLVSAVALSGPFDRTLFQAGVDIINTRYRMQFGESIFATHRYLAGTDDSRINQWNHALAQGEVKAVFSARGGYGAMRLLPQLNFGALPRPFVGFSDVTAVHLAAQSIGLRSIHGPVLTQLAKQPPDVVSRLFEVMEGRSLSPLFGTHTVVNGIASGPLLGGNLAVLTRLIGTPWLPSFSGSILLLEDVAERPYQIDRMLTHLNLSGVLNGLAGIVFGEFTQCDEKDATYGHREIIEEFAQNIGVPCALGFKIGHGEINYPVVLGASVRLDATQCTLHFLEGIN
jgi:muramoyltetrapeptide carboxypeptidase